MGNASPGASVSRRQSQDDSGCVSDIVSNTILPGLPHFKYQSAVRTGDQVYTRHERCVQYTGYQQNDEGLLKNYRLRRPLHRHKAQMQFRLSQRITVYSDSGDLSPNSQQSSSNPVSNESKHKIQDRLDNLSSHSC